MRNSKLSYKKNKEKVGGKVRLLGRLLRSERKLCAAFPTSSSTNSHQTYHNNKIKQRNNEFDC